MRWCPGAPQRRNLRFTRRGGGKTMSAVSPLRMIRTTPLPRPPPIPARSLPVVTAALALLAGSWAAARDHDDLRAAAHAILGANQGVYVEAGDGGGPPRPAPAPPRHPPPGGQRAPHARPV